MKEELGGSSAGRGRSIAAALSGSWRREPPGTRLPESTWKAITPLLIRSGAGGLAWRQVRGSQIRSWSIAHQLREAFQFQVLQIALCERELQRILRRLRAAGLEPILVKGWAAAQLYPERGARPPGDIDLLLHPSQLDAAKAVLEKSGPYEVLVDLTHLEVQGLDPNDFEDLVQHSRLLPLEDLEARVLCPEDHLRALSIHLLKHGAYRPLWLCDIAVALEQQAPNFDWNRCLRGDRKRTQWVACAIGLAQQLLGASLRDAPVVDKAERLPPWLASAVLRQWDNPVPHDHWTPELFVEALRHPSRWPAAFRERWWDPIQSTIHVRGSLNSWPRLPYQLTSFLLRGAQYLLNVRVR